MVVVSFYNKDCHSRRRRTLAVLLFLFAIQQILLFGMTAKGSCLDKDPEFLPHHVISNRHGHEHPSIVDRYRLSHHGSGNGHVSWPSMIIVFQIGLLHELRHFELRALQRLGRRHDDEDDFSRMCLFPVLYNVTNGLKHKACTIST